MNDLTANASTTDGVTATVEVDVGHEFTDVVPISITAPAVMTVTDFDFNTTYVLTATGHELSDASDPICFDSTKRPKWRQRLVNTVSLPANTVHYRRARDGLSC